MERGSSPACLCVVDRSMPILVPPSEPTPYQVLPLEDVSVMAGLNTLTSSHLLVFKSSKDKPVHAKPAEIIRSGLERVLVPYYPLAGRIRRSSTGVLEVECDGSGAVFIVATAKGVPALGEVQDFPAQIVTELVPETLTREVEILPRQKRTLVQPRESIDVIHTVEKQDIQVQGTVTQPVVRGEDVRRPVTTTIIQPLKRTDVIRTVQLPTTASRVTAEEICSQETVTAGVLRDQEIHPGMTTTILPPQRRTDVVQTLPPAVVRKMEKEILVAEVPKVTQKKKVIEEKIRVREKTTPLTSAAVRDVEIVSPPKTTIIQPESRKEIQIVKIPGTERKVSQEDTRAQPQKPTEVEIMQLPYAAEKKEVRKAVREVQIQQIGAEVHPPAVTEQVPVADTSVTEEEAPPVIAATKTLEAPPLIVQVTELETGDFVLSVKLWRGVCDAAGLLHFLRGWAEMARGAHSISVYPQWTQELHRQRPIFRPFRLHFPSLLLALRSSASLSCHLHSRPRPEFLTSTIATLQIPVQDVMYLRKHLLASDNLSVSLFDVLAAHLWRQRTLALQLSPTSEVRLFFLAKPSTDDESDLQIPIVYYGRYTFNCQAVSTARELLDRPLSYAVRLIQDAKLHLDDNFTACMDDFTRLHCPCGFAPPEIFIFTELPKTNKNEFDFGIGMPAEVVDAVPSEVNIAALTSHCQDYDYLHVLMNNIPSIYVEKLKSLIANVTVYSCKM